MRRACWPPTSANNAVAVAWVSFWTHPGLLLHVLPEPCEATVRNGSRTDAAEPNEVVVISAGCVHRSERASLAQLYSRRARNTPVVWTVIQNAKFALPSVSVSNSTHASPVLPPDQLVLSHPHLTRTAVPSVA